MEVCKVDKDNLGFINFMPGFQSDFKPNPKHDNEEGLACFLNSMNWVDDSNNILRENVKASLSETALGAEEATEVEHMCHLQAEDIGEKRGLLGLLWKLHYLACLRQSLLEKCKEMVVCSLQLSPSIDEEMFERYWTEQVSVAQLLNKKYPVKYFCLQNLIPEQFSKPPPPAVVEVKPGVTISQPGERVLVEMVFDCYLQHTVYYIFSLFKRIFSSPLNPMMSSGVATVNLFVPPASTLTWSRTLMCRTLPQECLTLSCIMSSITPNAMTFPMEKSEWHSCK